MDVPVIRISPDAPTQPEVLRKTADRLIHALRAEPHFAVLHGPAPTEDPCLTVALARLIADTAPVKPGSTPETRRRATITRVEINPARAAGGTGFTSYSRTHRALAAHTDSSFAQAPHDLVAFQMVRSAATGGETLIAPIEPVISALPQKVRQTLAQPIFPFGKGPMPILWRTKGAEHIRYYRQQIDESGEDLPAHASAAMDALDAALARDDLLFRFPLAPGETLFLHNTRALHGRTGFTETSDRLMHRVRIAAGCLG